VLQCPDYKNLQSKQGPGWEGRNGVNHEEVRREQDKIGLGKIGKKLIIKLYELRYIVPVNQLFTGLNRA